MSAGPALLQGAPKAFTKDLALEVIQRAYQNTQPLSALPLSQIQHRKDSYYLPLQVSPIILSILAIKLTCPHSQSGLQGLPLPLNLTAREAIPGNTTAASLLKKSTASGGG